MKFILCFCITICILILFYCSKSPTESELPNDNPQENKLIQIAQSNRLWTGVAVSENKRIFINYPRWSSAHSFSVIEIDSSGNKILYPDNNWNNWNPSLPPEDHFVCVQSVFIDKNNFLWILDAGNPLLQIVVENGAKLIKIDITTNQIIQKILFSSSVAPIESYLNDVRIDTGYEYAYITDSGLGAIIVVNLATHNSWRLLSNHSSTKSEDMILTVEGIEWVYENSEPREVHSDGIALDLNGDYLYYQALTARTLYRIKTEYLRDTTLTNAQLGNRVESLGEIGAADGIAFSPDGNLYLTSIELNAIRRLTPAGGVEVVIADPLLKWPDSFSITNDSIIYVTTSHIHLGPSSSEPYYLFKYLITQNN